MHPEQLAQQRVALIGGGIGGLAAALSLHQIGMRPVIYEAARQIDAVGVGIHLLPNGVRELAELGLLDALRARSIATRRILYLNRFGQTIWENPRGEYAGYRWPQLAIHRGALQELLLETVAERLGESALQTGLRCRHAEISGEHVLLRFEDRNNDCETEELADAAIACDGVHSRIRELLWPENNEPVFHGSIMWRGVSACDPFLGGDTMLLAGDPSCKFICYPIPSYGDIQPPPGKLLLNWIADVRNDPAELRERRDWYQRGNPAHFLYHFADWQLGYLDIAEVVNSAYDCFVYPKVDKEPLQQWGRGRITLLGDAAHPTYPSGSQGASQAVIDARVLEQAFLLQPTVTSALLAYEESRRPATTRLVQANRAARQELLLQLVQDRAPDGFTDINQVLPPEEFDRVFEQFKQIAGHDIATLNERSSLVPGYG